MKFILFLIIALVLALLADSAKETSKNLNIGRKRHGDRLLYSRDAIAQPRKDQSQEQDISYSGGPKTNVSAIYVNEIGRSQLATVRLIKGGIGTNPVLIRVTSAWGKGFHYRVKIWGRLNKT